VAGSQASGPDRGRETLGMSRVTPLSRGAEHRCVRLAVHSGDSRRNGGPSTALDTRAWGTGVRSGTADVGVSGAVQRGTRPR